MAKFDITIIDTPPVPVVYTSSRGIKSINNCAPIVQKKYSIILSSIISEDYAIIDSYFGDSWKTLHITGISYSFVPGNLPCGCMDVSYNNNIITNVDLPLAIDIQALTINATIPLLEIITDNYSGSSNEMESVNITFKLEDINGTFGESTLSSFQVFVEKCPTPPVLTPVINSALSSTFTIDPSLNYFFEYYITSLYPVTSYGTTGLPVGSFFNQNTGFIKIDAAAISDWYNDVIIQFDILAINSNAVPTADTKTYTLTIKAYSSGIIL